MLERVELEESGEEVRGADWKIQSIVVGICLVGLLPLSPQSNWLESLHPPSAYTPPQSVQGSPLFMLTGNYLLPNY